MNIKTIFLDIFVFSTFCFTINAQIPTNGLVAFYPFNGDASDESGNGNNGTIFGASLTEDRCGNPSSAFNFDGIDNYINLGFDFDYPQRTINLWFYAGTIDLLARHLYISDNPQLEYGFSQIKILETNGIKEIRSSAGNTGYEGASEIMEKSWYFVTLLVNGDSVKHYLNGELIGSFINGNGTSLNGYTSALLGTSRVFDRYFNGKIDDISIYNRALSSDEILSLYNTICNIGEINGDQQICPGQQDMVYYIQPISMAANYSWSYTGIGASISENGYGIIVDFANNATSGSITVTVTGSGLTTQFAELPIIIKNLPQDAENISGPNEVCYGQNGVNYNIPVIQDAENYLWQYSGTGESIIGSTNNVSLQFAENATSGNLTVTGINSCGNGIPSSEFPININSCNEIPTNGLIAYYPFNGNANDESGNGNDGIIYGAKLEEDRCGNPNSAFLFNGIDEYMELPNDFDLSKKTINFWFKPLRFKADIGIIYTSDHPFLNYGLTCVSVFKNVNENLLIPNINDQLDSFKVDSGLWQMVTLIQDEKHYNYFLNSNLIESGSFNTYITSDNGYNKALLGCSRVFHRFFNGFIDDVRIYNRALSSEEILSLYNTICNIGEINGDQQICPGQQDIVYNVQTISMDANYSWSYTGIGASILENGYGIIVDFANNATSGSITVTVSGSGLTTQFAELPIIIKNLPQDAENISGPNVVCYGQNGVNYNIPVIQDAENYLWQYSGTGASIIGSTNNVSLQFAENATSGNLTVTGINSCGTGTPSSEFPININSCNENPLNLYIPNAFSPNGDGINDLFVIKGIVENSKLLIFDRSGDKIFESDNYHNDWNGVDLNGTILETGTYWYVFTIQGIQNEFKGFVYLKK